PRRRRNHLRRTGSSARDPRRGLLGPDRPPHRRERHGQRGRRKEPGVSTVVDPAKALRHGLILGGRGIRKIFKNPEQLLDVTIAPLSVLVVFVYLFGGAIAGDTDTYLHTLVPGIMVMTTFQACMGTGMTLNNDVTKGVFDRFRSLPIARSAPLVGAVLADFVRYLVCLGVLVAVATLMGYRVQTDPALLVVAVALMV